ncbi:MAG: hypothetical protein M3Y08_03050 [Fibrobacterota bacterium]|nr:hypothetical protein [Fibrobacterota bacterium]
MQMTATESATETYPSFESISVQEYTQTGLNRYTWVRRDPDNGGLITQEFQENQQHGGEVHAGKPVSWDETVPAGSRLVSASAGNVNEFHKTFWVAWFESAKASALALVQENPVPAAMLPGDRIIHPPVQYLDQKLRIFFWRKTEGEHALYNHVFTGEPMKKGAVTTVKLLSLPYEPLFPTADPIAMRWVRKKGFEDAGIAVIGWLSAEGGGMKGHAAVLDGKGIKVIDSDPIAGYNPHPRQRIGIWSAPDGEIRMTWLMGRVDADSVRVAEWSANGSTGKMNLRIRENGYLGSNVQRTAAIIPRDTEDSTARMFILTKTGNLYLDDNGGRLRKLRSGLPQSYDFPIFASAVGIWEARHDGKGAVFFTTP